MPQQLPWNDQNRTSVTVLPGSYIPLTLPHTRTAAWTPTCSATSLLMASASCSWSSSSPLVWGRACSSSEDTLGEVAVGEGKVTKMQRKGSVVIWLKEYPTPISYPQAWPQPNNWALNRKGLSTVQGANRVEVKCSFTTLSAKQEKRPSQSGHCREDRKDSSLLRKDQRASFKQAWDIPTLKNLILETKEHKQGPKFDLHTCPAPPLTVSTGYRPDEFPHPSMAP